TWDYDQCKYVNPKVWIGYQAPGQVAHFVRVAVDGTVEETVMVQGWNGQGYSPYGGALDPEFRPWMGGLRGEFVRINTDQNPITVDRFTPPPNTQSYGFTVDPDGNPWFAGCGGPVSTYNTDTMQYTAIAGTNACYRGIAADENYVWAASNGPCGLAQIDRKTNTLIQIHNTNPCSTAIGVSIDAEKFVWLVDQEGWAWKIDPENVPAMKQVMVPGSHYVYSDMTGGQLNSILPQ
ncbi:MAG: lyase, partial [Myxococcales bacterium]|nr:lyase [Myxococcales bacterium]